MKFLLGVIAVAVALLAIFTGAMVFLTLSEKMEKREEIVAVAVPVQGINNKNQVIINCEDTGDCAVAVPESETPTITNVNQVVVNVPSCTPVVPKSAPKPMEKVSEPKPAEKKSEPKPTVKTSVKTKPISVSSTIRVEPMQESAWYLEIHADLQEMKHRREEMERRIYVSSDDVYPDGGDGGNGGGSCSSSGGPGSDPGSGGCSSGGGPGADPD